MSVLEMFSTHQEDWFKKFDPQKRVLTGQAFLLVKRFMDLFLVVGTLPLWLPLIAIIALIIRFTSPGAPVVFRQLRTGKGGRRFNMYKFRTMVHNAEELKAVYAHLNEHRLPDFKITNDPRITPIGRFLRKTSLDELPELFNVVHVQMSVADPLPTSVGPETYQLWHTERLDVMSGMTGLWQIIGRAHLEFDDRLRLDIAYIERASIWLDIHILLRTFLAVFQQRGAY